MHQKEIKVVGLGGIGSWLVSPLCRYLQEAYPQGIVRVTLIDGDSYQKKNENRQEFSVYGNKAEVKAEELKVKYPRLSIKAKPQYVTRENAFHYVREGDVVFACPDNHATRKILSDHCQTLANVVLISGGNGYTTHSVQVYVRREGVDITPPLTHLHPEIASPADRNPADMSCEELAQSGEPQLIFTNVKTAVEMLGAFWVTEQNKDAMLYREQHGDVEKGNTRSIGLIARKTQ